MIFLGDYIIAVTLDNAASNTVMISTLSDVLIQEFDVQFHPDNAQIRCLNHILNITRSDSEVNLLEALVSGLIREEIQWLRYYSVFYNLKGSSFTKDIFQEFEGFEA